MSCCPGPFYDTEAHANNTLETDHGRLKARLRPMRGLKRDHTATVIVTGHAFVQNLRRGFYDLGTDVPSVSRLSTRSLNWPSLSDTCPRRIGTPRPGLSQRNSARTSVMRAWSDTRVCRGWHLVQSRAEELQRPASR